MKAVVITREGDPSVLTLRDVPEPKPGPRDLLVRVKASALNRADALQRMGRYPAPAGTRQDIPGLEFAGVVDWAGPETEGFSVGDRVMGLLPGEGQAEFVATPAVTAMKIPRTLTFEEAAAIPEAYLTAHDALSLQLGLRKSESVLVHAVGSGVGTAAVQLAREIGAKTIGTSRSPEKLRRALLLGLNHGIDSKESAFDKVVLELTGGKGAEAILDLVGAPYWHANIGCLAARGRIILVGLMGGQRAEADLGTIVVRRLHIIGTVLRSRTVEEKAELTQDFAEDVLPLFETGTLKPVVDCVFPIERISEAHDYLENNRNFGKIVLTLE